MPKFRRGPLRPQEFFSGPASGQGGVGFEVTGSSDGTGGTASVLLEMAAITGLSAGVGGSVGTNAISQALTGATAGVGASSALLSEQAAITGVGAGTGGSSIISGVSAPLAEAGPGWRPRPRPQVIPQPPQVRIPVHAQLDPTIVEVDLPEPDLAVDRKAITAALLAAGAIDRSQFDALLAA